MRQVRHPLVGRDVDGIFDHLLATTRGDLDAAERRLDKIDDLLAAIAANPLSGVRLSGPMAGWLLRHGGRDRHLSIVFQPEPGRGFFRIALVAFGGRNWLAEAERRRDFGDA